MGVYYIVNFLPTISHNLTKGTKWGSQPQIIPINPVLRHLLNLASLYLIIIFFLVGLILFKKLIFINRTKRDIQLWNIFQIVLLASVIFNFTSLNIPTFLSYLYLVGGLIIVLLLTIRLRWVAFLKKREKKSAILLLIPNSIICLLLSKHLLELNNPYVLHVDIFRNVFLILSASFVSSYTVFSLLALIFNLPIAHFMEQRELEISSFHEINRIIQGEFAVPDILEKLFRISFNNTQAEGGWINVNDKKLDHSTFEVHQIQKEEVQKIEAYAEQHFDEEEESLYIEKVSQLPAFSDHELSSPIEAILILPIKSKERLIGWLGLTKSYSHSFDEFMIRLVKTYIDQASLAIENTEHLNEALEAERLKEEVEIAQSMHNKLLPKSLPDNDEIALSGFSQPASEVGGDFYDYYQVSPDEYVVIIADVSGKGTPAAFHMSEMKGIFQALVQENYKPQHFIEQANKALRECLGKAEFITVGFLYINTHHHYLKYYRGGQCPFLYYDSTKKDLHYLQDEGMALGILPSSQYREFITSEQIQYNSNDFLILVTDGILEARKSGKMVEFGAVRLKDTVQEYLSTTSQPTTHAMNVYILKKLYRFMEIKDNTNQAFDDITLVTIHLK